MAKLVLSMDGLVLKEIPLVKERLSIGRKAHNDIQIDNMAISGEHAVVVTILNDSFLEDLNSTNGTLVNGQPIRKHVLKDGDVIEFGKYRMKYITGSSESTDDLWQTTSIGFSAGVTGRPAPAPGGQAGGTTLPAATIRLLNGANAGHQLKLTKTLTTLGKPGQVAVIARKPQGYFLTHVEGGEFPLLNGQAVDVRPRRLENHDLIEIAGVKMEFFFNN